MFQSLDDGDDAVRDCHEPDFSWMLLDVAVLLSVEGIPFRA